MSMLYWFALVVGAGLLLLSLFGDFFGDDIDLPDDVDAGDAHGHGFDIFSIRNATYFLFAFGAAGLLVGRATGNTLLTLSVATVLGMAGGGISAVAFGWLRRTESGGLVRDAGWGGRTGHVVLPLSAEGTGKIRVTHGGREHELLARPFERGAESPEQWRSVLIVELENGVALVTPYTGALGSPDAQQTLPTPEP